MVPVSVISQATQLVELVPGFPVARLSMIMNADHSNHGCFPRFVENE